MKNFLYFCKINLKKNTKKLCKSSAFAKIYCVYFRFILKNAKKLAKNFNLFSAFF